MSTDSATEQTGLWDSSEPDDDPHAERMSGEAEFRKYLEPASRSGWLGRLSHYEIEEILGCGAYGIVAKAFDEKLHRVVAIKLISPTIASTSPPRKRFLREARTAAAVTHENIVAIHAVEEEPIPYLVMEYIPGQTLQQRMDENGPLEVPDILRIGQQVAAGLAAAHAVNLIHRDIKPSNVLLNNERAKISDFGLARAVDDATLTSSGLIAGTPLYMAPEQARGDTLDHRTDLFSLGSVLYQMASGRPPFRAANMVAVLKRVCEDTPRSLNEVIPDIPHWLETIIFRLLEKEREERYQTAQEVAELLARCQRELEDTGKVTCVDERGRNREDLEADSRSKTRSTVLRRRTVGWLSGGIIALCVILVLATMIERKPSAESNSSTLLIASKNKSSSPESGTVSKLVKSNSRQDESKANRRDSIQSPSVIKSLQLAPLADVETTEPLSDICFVTRPESIPGILSWTIETSVPRCVAEEANMSLNPDRTLMATGGIDGMIRIYDVETARLRKAYALHDTQINSLTWSPDGNLVASRSGGELVQSLGYGTILIWEPDTGRVVSSLPKSIYADFAWSPDGKILAIAGDKLRTWQRDSGDVKEWKLAPRMGNKSRSIAWSPDGNSLAIMYYDSRVEVWDVNSTERLAQLKAPFEHGCLQFSPDGKQLAGCCDFAFKPIAVWSTDDWKLTSFDNVKTYSLLWTSDSRQLVVGDVDSNTAARIRLLDLETRKLGRPTYLDGSMYPPSDLAWSAHENELIVGSVHYYRARLADQGGAPIMIQRNQRGAGSMTWSPAGDRLVHTARPGFSNWYAGAFNSWDLVSCGVDAIKPYVAAELKISSPSSWSPDGKYVLVGNQKKFSLFDRELRNVIVEIPSSSVITSYAWSPDSSKYAILQSEGRIRIFNLAGRILEEFPVQKATYGTMAWNAGGTRLAYCCDNNEVCFWEAASGEITIIDLEPYGIPAITRLVSSTDESLFAGFYYRSNKWILMDGEISEITQQYLLPDQDRAVDLNWMSDEKGIQCCSRSGIIYSSMPGDLGVDKQCELQHPVTLPYAVDGRFSANGDLVATCTGRGPAELFISDTETGRLVMTLVSLRNNHWISISPEGHYKGSEKIEEEIVYIAKMKDGSQQTFTPAEFTEKFDWKNEPDKVRIYTQ